MTSGEEPMHIYRVLRGRVLPCGCLVGVYETFSGGVVGIIDQRGSGCPEASHRIGVPVEATLLIDDRGASAVRERPVTADDVVHVA